ncbi:MAG: TetR/AcrR family transcriptional regulator [Acidimicrobiales bacterium]
MAGITEVKEAKHGRPRDPHVDAAIRRAALDVLMEEGFARMSIEGVASRAGVGKAAIYRRWDNKTALVLDAIHDLLAPHMQDWPETDDIRADLEVILRQFLNKIRGVEGELMKAVASELVRYPEVAALVRDQFVDCNKQILKDRITQAQADGVLAPGDAELQGECGFAIIFHRALLSGSPLTDDLPHRLVEQFFPAGPAAP